MSISNNYRALFATFPKEEYIERCKKAQKIMASKDIDVMILTQKENIEYFSGYYTTHWAVKGIPNGVVLFYADEMPALVVPDFLSGTAERTSWLEDVIIHHKTHAKPRDLIHMVVDLLKTKKLLNKRIAIEMGPEIMINLTKEDHDILMDALSDAEIVSSEDIIWGTRSIKSEREIECIRKAVASTAKAYKALKDNFLKHGVSEIDIAKYVQIKMLEYGADGVGFINFRAGRERYPMGDTYPQERTIREGDMLVLDGGALYKGYWADICRVVHVGTPSKEHLRMHEIALNAQKAGINVVKAGTKVSEIYKAVRQILKESKVQDRLSMCGHAVGKDLHEPPILTADCDTILEEGMVITIEPWIHDYDGLGIIAVEDIVVVTAEGCENITNLEKKDLWTI
ncbi:M24 family metallopeptidase [Schnuerera ultunensis]|uniref:Putative Xaa-Pro dipeptidase n=1 Tax=[Clostridium] ultunense Esp TaxID=1288971 RepID=A0A1M4PKJ8_9FIRM|nr:Xaa-Pro peptidase family protein [Schnuerera ultunensis]SHD75973.1 putative Xaa-Pro dipeptidase [[Clostridium] ultunense Esp]